ncbi:hypothetical protein BTS2_0533 [Bacillus sp. TS-2]|nr:hypothetical protein BTS2_0533 [Bacillus sp. TS-2]
MKQPEIKFECVEDRYVTYCLISRIAEKIFWHYPIASVERIYQGKQAYDGWKNNPQPK